jgi:two-component system, NtrC family, sensor kinase
MVPGDPQSRPEMMKDAPSVSLMQWGDDHQHSLEEEKRYYRGLTRRMVIMIVVVSLTPLVLISGLTRHYFQAAYSKEVVEHLQERLLRHRTIVDAFLAERLGALRLLAGSCPPDQLTDERFLQEKLSLLQEQFGPSLQDLGIINESGVLVAYVGPYKLRGVDYSKAPWYKRARQHEQSVSDVFMGLRGFPHLAITVRHEIGGKPCLIRSSLDFNAFNALVQPARLGATGAAFIANRAGVPQTRGPDERTGPGAPLKDHAMSGPDGQDQVSVSQSETEFGTRYLKLSTTLNQGEWTMVYQVSMDEAFSEMYAARNSAILVFFLGTMSILVVSTVVSSQMTHRIAQAVQEKQVIHDQLIEAGKLASLGELAAGVAHEINNPVGIMVQEAGWMQDLMEDDLTAETLEEFRLSLNKIVIQGKRCKDITRKLLAFARKTDPTIKTCQLNEIIQEVVALSQPQAYFNRVKVKMSLEPNLPKVRVSPSEMQQIFLNLINNSIDALGNGGGTIEVTTSTTEADRVFISVSDDGCGIPQAYLTRIFDPFFTTKPVGKGTGLGLSICYGIIKRIGGDIRVDSQVGAGTRFLIDLPVPQEDSD